MIAFAHNYAYVSGSPAECSERGSIALASRPLSGSVVFLALRLLRNNGHFPAIANHSPEEEHLLSIWDEQRFE